MTKAPESLHWWFSDVPEQTCFSDGADEESLCVGAPQRRGGRDLLLEKQPLCAVQR